MTATGVQCPTCGAQLGETRQSAERQYVFPMLDCPGRHGPFTSAVSRDGKRRLAPKDGKRGPTQSNRHPKTPGREPGCDGDAPS